MSDTIVCIDHQPCPKCRSLGKDMHGDNLGVYSDGHLYCFSCGYYKAGDKLQSLKEAKPGTPSINPVPMDTFSNEALKYLKSFGLTQDEIDTYFQPHIDGYMYGNNAWKQVRRLNKTPKVLTYGKVRGNEMILYCDWSTTIIIVEDIISAVKVSRVHNCVPLCGSYIPLELHAKLNKTFKTCGVWLDPDKQKESFVEANEAKWYYDSSFAVVSDKDPKYYSTEEIKSRLT